LLGELLLVDGGLQLAPLNGDESLYLGLLLRLLELQLGLGRFDCLLLGCALDLLLLLPELVCLLLFLGALVRLSLERLQFALLEVCLREGLLFLLIEQVQGVLLLSGLFLKGLVVSLDLVKLLQLHLRLPDRLLLLRLHLSDLRYFGLNLLLLLLQLPLCLCFLLLLSLFDLLLQGHLCCALHPRLRLLFPRQ
jgi:hypothetical protein